MLKKQRRINTSSKIVLNDNNHMVTCDFVKSIAASGFGVSIREMNAVTRSTAETAFARQVAMYLCHTVLQLKPGKTAIAFNRNRSTVNHACQLVEDQRDDPCLDFTIGCMERSIEEWQAICRQRLSDPRGDQ